MESPTDSSAAIREIERITLATVEPKVVQVPVSDGKGGSTTVPVLVTHGQHGAAVTYLQEALERGTAFFTQQRLAAAAGPDRRQGTAALQTLESFIQHANRFKAPSSAIWADAGKRLLVSVLDYHPEGADSAARWGRHRGLYACPLSEAWQAWGGGHALELDQDGFAALLDTRDRELSGGALNGKPAPDPSTLITLAANLETYSNASAKRERDPNTNRVKISYSEEKGVAGSVLPPPSFLIFIPVFQDSKPQPLEVRLRVTVESAHARFHVQIHAASDVLRKAFAEVCADVATETSLPVLVGTPEQ